MKHTKLIIVLSGVLLASCSSTGVQKKILLMGKGDIVVADKKVNMTKGSGYAEKEISINDKEASSLTVETEAGTKEYSIPAENGYYILNLKKDTIAGSVQLMGKDISNKAQITQEELKLKIDSITKMIAGQNINNKNNFVVLPNQLVKVSNNLEAQVFGPFKKIPAQLEVPADNKDPEIYKFYTNEELRDLTGKLKKLTY